MLNIPTLCYAERSYARPSIWRLGLRQLRVDGRNSKSISPPGKALAKPT